MFKAKRFVYVIFMCHLSVEKSLKAIVADKINKVPPKTHDLFLLVKLAGLDIADAHKTIISHLKEASVPTRYPEDISRLIKDYNKNVADRYLTQVKALLKWLKTQLN